MADGRTSGLYDIGTYDYALYDYIPGTGNQSKKIVIVDDPKPIIGTDNPNAEVR